MTKQALPDDLNETQALSLLHTLAAADPDYPRVVEQLAPLAALSLPATQQATLARDTLGVLSEHPQQAQAITALLNNPAAQRFDVSLTGAGILVTVVFLLRTHIKFTRKSDQSWAFQIEHKPNNSQTLTTLLNKLSALLPTGDQH